MNRTSAFTIVELLIVIVVIAILASISVVAYNGIQTRAKASAISSDLKALDKGFRLLATQEGRTNWWIDNEFTGSSNPSITTVIEDTDLKNYFQKFSKASEDSATAARYDNDNDLYGGCDQNSTGGVNIYLYGVEQSIALAVDNSIDDGNINCGSVTFGGGNLRYNISKVQEL